MFVLLFRLTIFSIATFLLFYKTSYPNKEANCTDMSRYWAFCAYNANYDTFLQWANLYYMMFCFRLMQLIKGCWYLLPVMLTSKCNATTILIQTFLKFGPFQASFSYIYYLQFSNTIQYYLVIICPLVMLPYPHHWWFP